MGSELHKRGLLVLSRQPMDFQSIVVESMTYIFCSKYKFIDILREHLISLSSLVKLYRFVIVHS